MQHQLIGHDAVKSPVTFREMRSEAVFDEIDEFRRGVGNMVEYQVETKIEALADAFDIGPGAKSRINFQMGQGRKATIGVGWKDRQQMHAADQFAQSAFKEPGKIGKIPADTIGVTNQLDLIFEGHDRPFRGVWMQSKNRGLRISHFYFRRQIKAVYCCQTRDFATQPEFPTSSLTFNQRPVLPMIFIE